MSDPLNEDMGACVKNPYLWFNKYRVQARSLALLQSQNHKIQLLTGTMDSVVFMNGMCRSQKPFVKLLCVALHPSAQATVLFSILLVTPLCVRDPFQKMDQLITFNVRH